MSSAEVRSRRAFRRTDDFTPGTAKVKLVHEEIPIPLPPRSVLIKVHAISLNYRDANIAHGGNPWPVIPHGILCNDAAGEVVGIGADVKAFRVGDRAAPITDTKFLNARSTERSWLAANEDGVLADYIVFHEDILTKLPTHLGWVEASVIPCAGTTAWSALKGASLGQTVLIQGTGGVAMVALKLARAAGLRVILSSSSSEKLKTISDRYANPPIWTVNYKENSKWEEEVLRLTDGVGVDLVVEVGGNHTIVQSIKATRRGGIVSVVGYLSGQDTSPLDGLLPIMIDRRVNVRGINAGSKQDQDDLVAAISAAGIRFDDIIDSTRPFEEAPEAIEYIWEGKQVGKLVLRV